jgi:hypothetical protein
MPTMVRETWTDERLDEFAKRMDERFDAVDQRLEGIERHLQRLEEKVERGFAAMTSRYDRLTGILIIGLLGLIGTQL